MKIRDEFLYLRTKIASIEGFLQGSMEMMAVRLKSIDNRLLEREIKMATKKKAPKGKSKAGKKKSTVGKGKKK